MIARLLPPQSGVTLRSVLAGFVLALVLCGMNSYLTLSFGVIEEGPTIAALFFFAIFFVSKLPITVTEMVIVSTMGSAGGSLGFIANFFAAKAMTGAPYSVFEMTAFSVVSSLVGLVMVIPLRQLLILREELPWPGSKAVAGVIRALVEEGAGVCLRGQVHLGRARRHRSAPRSTRSAAPSAMRRPMHDGQKPRPAREGHPQAAELALEEVGKRSMTALLNAL